MWLAKKHRYTRPGMLRSNGMVEWFNHTLITEGA